jgi:hypothetical protein
MAADMSPKIITGPNTYYFTSTVYYAEATDTNATIAVGFYPGDPSWTGSVGFSTGDGTALSGQDYTTVSNTVWFSGQAPRTVNVAICPSRSPADKTVKLSLSKTRSDDIITTGAATLILRGAPCPTLAIALGASNTIRLSWPAAYTNYVVESSAADSSGPTQWSLMNSPSEANDQFVVIGNLGEQNHFFRLRQKQ